MESTASEASPARGVIGPALGRGAEVVLGLVLLASGLLKAADINLFIVQLTHYGLPGVWIPAYGGILAMGAELFLGALLLLGTRRRRVALLLTILMLIAYTGLIAVAWVRYGLDDCGCMGPVKMSPPVGIAKNILLLVLCGVAWMGVSRRVGPEPWGKRLGWMTARAGAAVVVALAAAVYAHGQIEQVRPEIMGDRPFSGMVVRDAGQTLDLGQGEYLVFVLGTVCSHCRKAVPALNEYNRREDLPPVVGLCTQPLDRLDKFRERAKPEFPIGMIGRRAFYNLLGLTIPRFILTRDGEVLAIWDGALPTADTVVEVLSRPVDSPKTLPPVL